MKNNASLIILTVALVMDACQQKTLLVTNNPVFDNEVYVIDKPELLKTISIPASEIKFHAKIDETLMDQVEKKRNTKSDPETNRFPIVKQALIEYGDDGTLFSYYPLDTDAKTYRTPITQGDLNSVLIKQITETTNQFLTRITLVNGPRKNAYALNNGDYDCLILATPHGGYAVLPIVKGKSPLYKLDGKELTEAQIQSLDAETIAKIRHVGVDYGFTALKAEGKKGANGKLFISTTLSGAFGGVVAKRPN